ncbi:MAG: hypothetical protein A2W80_16135 [Candidatus Riflebacteria bacterium GWC2_50_8]|nr:MAG: hypothetical protein A2W80_16135 [Candidatus Riflebacteria bacterium GWC2_50_8]
MLSWPFPASKIALAAAIEIQKKFSRKSRELAGLQVKISIHRGPVIFSRNAARIAGRISAGQRQKS